ncbi:hypothetical protein FB451DRAFT_1182536 [Mycena latifolia]|nr:hypothetical protein FB451DRAFT_1182536 [Mycena latifolia]
MFLYGGESECKRAQAQVNARTSYTSQPSQIQTPLGAQVNLPSQSDRAIVGTAFRFRAIVGTSPSISTSLVDEQRVRTGADAYQAGGCSQSSADRWLRMLDFDDGGISERGASREVTVDEQMSFAE